MATMNTADIGFEREIWKAADKMRGNIDASEYKSVVLGLIFRCRKCYILIIYFISTIYICICVYQGTNWGQKLG